MKTGSKLFLFSKNIKHSEKTAIDHKRGGGLLISENFRFLILIIL